LDDQKVRRIERKQPPQLCPNQFRMEHRIGLPRAIEPGCGEAIEAMVSTFQPGMLAGDEQVGGLAEGGECMDDRT